ncbi:MAG: alpha/beta hydrolase, partial [Pseudomonadota bacterium]|nr:alpha/beta hydrolase [Pseudomonadota bacterium]
MPDRCELVPSLFHQLAGGARIRYARLEPGGPARATALVACGRREFIEKKLAESGAQLLDRGFRLIVFEWRGQGLSDRFLTGALRQRDHITDFNVHLDDLSSFYENVVLPVQQGPLIAFGHSMGSHLLLRWFAERQKTGIHAAVLAAPMLALGPRAAHVVALGIGWTAGEFGFGENYGP